MDPISQFEQEVHGNVRRLGAEPGLFRQTLDWMVRTGAAGNYTYNFRWLGRPIIQYPQDMVAMQEIVWATRPDLIVETGIAHGGSLILSASLLALLDLSDAAAENRTMDPSRSGRCVLGIDIDIRPHNRTAIEAHPLASRIRMVQGSSIDPGVVAEVRSIASGFRRVMVCLDSNHTHEHVRAELDAYAPLTSVGCYCVVFDTVVEDAPAECFANRPWGPGNSPMSAVHEWLPRHPEFEIDRDLQHKLLITVAREGYLRRVG
jgi:cephalosporin hydroxylase